MYSQNIQNSIGNQALKAQLMKSYLQQQSQAQNIATSQQIALAQNIINAAQQRNVPQQPQAPPPSPTPAPTPKIHELVQVTPDNIPENVSLEEFREYVRKWLELDNTIKKALEAIREKKKVRDKLSQVISSFMCKYNIEDLNTKEGRIRCKVSTVRAPVNQKLVKQKITDYFSNDEAKKADILSKIYEEREKVEKVSLRRLKIT